MDFAPFVAVSGGAKVSSKLGVLNNLLTKVDAMCIGGAMANTFLKAKGLEVGKSLVEDDLLGEAKAILAAADEKGVKLGLPVDFVISRDAGKPLSEMTAAGVVAEAMMALVVAQACLEKFGGDSLSETRRNYLAYLKRLRDRGLGVAESL